MFVLGIFFFPSTGGKFNSINEIYMLVSLSLYFENKHKNHDLL